MGRFNGIVTRNYRDQDGELLCNIYLKSLKEDIFYTYIYKITIKLLLIAVIITQ